MAIPEITRVEAYTELKRLKEDILLGMFHGVDSSEEILHARIDILLGRLEGNCAANPEEWFRLTPFQAQVMNAMSHLSDSQELVDTDTVLYGLVNDAKRALTLVLDKTQL